MVRDASRLSAAASAAMLLALTCFLGIGGPARAQTSQSTTPAITIGTAGLLSPSAADTWYAAQPGFTTFTTNGPGQTNQNEIVELARALHHDPDQIYKYVNNNIEIVWMYGLQKGSLGAIIDRTGTAFDQAKLMVDLLRQSGYTANFVSGTITLSGTQFQAWSNISDATAACQMLSSGGIPASINGTTSADCTAYNHATITTIQLSHIWVSVTINGASYVYDPAYKAHTFNAGINLKTAAGLTSGDALSAASGPSSGMTSVPVTTNSVSTPAIENINESALYTKLQSYGVAVLSAIKSKTNGNAPAPEVEDIVGGQLISRSEIPTGGYRNTTLPYSSFTVQHTWSGSVPDIYRTTLTVKAVKLSDGISQTDITMWNTTFFVDDIYGRKLTITTNFPGTFNVGPDWTYSAQLKVTDEFGNSSSTTPTYSDGGNPLYSKAVITLTANHPYAASANGPFAGPDGTYMDSTTSKMVWLLEPLTVVHAWGDANGLVAKWGTRDDTLDPSIPNFSGAPNLAPQLPTAGDGRREELAAAWIVQSSKASRLHAQIGQSVFQLHHSIGVVSSAGEPHGQIFNFNGNTPEYFDIGDSADVIDVDSGLSLTSLTANQTQRNAVVQAIAATADALEGSVNAQGPDMPDTTSTATRFEWGASPPVNDTFDDPSNAGPRRFVTYTGANASQAGYVTLVEGQSSNSGVDWQYGCTPPPWGSIPAPWYQGPMAAAAQAYTGAGYVVTASQEGLLGPGLRASFFQCWNNNGSIVAGPGDSSDIYGTGTITEVTEDQGIINIEEFDSGISTGGGVMGTPNQSAWGYSLQRGGALVATRYDNNGNPIQIAHVITGPDGYRKGGGAGTQADLHENWDPSQAADILKARFVDHSSALGVDLKTGDVTWTAPAKLSVGSGEFPNKLEAGLYFRQGYVETDQGLLPHSQPVGPWTTNWNNSLTISGSGLEALGQSDPRPMAGTIAAFLAAQDVFTAAQSPQRDVTAVLTQAWWVRQLTGNVVTVSLGTATEQFDKLIDGTWIEPGPGVPSTLVQTGSRAEAMPNCHDPASQYPPAMAWDYHNVAFTLTNPHGDVQTWAYWDYKYPQCAFLHGWHLTQWTFPKGVTVNLAYGNNSDGTSQLLSVSNSLGRQIDFINSGLGGFTNHLTGADARSVSVTNPTATGWPELPTVITDQNGAGLQNPPVTTALVHSAPWEMGPNYVLDEIYTANSGVAPSLAYTYDTLNRVNGAQDADSLQYGTSFRAPYQFFIANQVRGDRIDPTGASFRVEFDVKQRPIQYFDELGRESQVTYDGRQRALNYTYPEGDQQQFVYYDSNNVASLTAVASPGSPQSGQTQTVQATWDPVWGKLATLKDARGNTTAFTYVGTQTTNYGSGAGEMATATRPKDIDGNPVVYTFAYDTAGSMDSATDPTGLVAQNGYDSFENLTTNTVDPGASPHVHSVTTFGYDNNGELISITDPRGNVINTTYDFDGRKIFVISPDPDGSGPLLRPAVKSTYDAEGHLIETDKGRTTSAVGSDFSVLESETYAYDPAGNNVQKITQAGVVQFSYDGLNHLVCTAVRMNPSVYGSLPSSACVQSTSATATGSQGPDRITQLVYDAAGQKLQENRAFGVTTANGYASTQQYNYATFTYGLDGEETSVTDADSDKTTNIYDGFLHLAEVDYPSTTLGSGASDGTNRALYAYDANGNLSQLTKRDGSAIIFTYDALNRQIVKSVPASPTGGAAFSVYTDYDTAGRKTHSHFTSRSGQGSDYAWDTAGRLVSETTFGRKMSFQYDVEGNQTEVIWPDTSPTFYAGYVYDNDNRVIAVNENGATSGVGLLATYSYDDLGHRVSISRGNGTSTTYTYDSADRITALNQAVITSGYNQSWAFAYSPASQVIDRTSSNHLYDWTTSATSPINHNYNGLNEDNAIALVGGYDKDGNLINDGTRAFTYDDENRLLSDTASGVTQVALSYDPTGRLNQSTAGGTATQFLYEGEHLVAEYNSSGTVLRRYVHGAGTDEPLVWYEGLGTASRQWLHADAEGSIVAWSDVNGNVSTSQLYEYGPYGEPSSWNGSRFRYTGQIEIPEAQLYYYKARVYDPIVGRFLQTDPAGYRSDLDLYAYTSEDPLNRSDPTGLGPMQEFWDLILGPKMDDVYARDPHPTQDQINDAGRREVRYKAVQTGLQTQVTILSLMPTPGEGVEVAGGLASAGKPAIMIGLEKWGLVDAANFLGARQLMGSTQITKDFLSELATHNGAWIVRLDGLAGKNATEKVANAFANGRVQEAIRQSGGRVAGGNITNWEIYKLIESGRTLTFTEGPKVVVPKVPKP